MEQFPDEILEEVLCRLTVKCLLRFRCVSKSWLALISGPYFVKLHLNRSFQTKRNLRLFRRNKDLFRVDFDSLHDGDVLQQVKVDSIPLTFLKYGLVPTCSCDGLLCMSNTRVPQYICLWSPTIRRNLNDGLPCCRPKIRETVFLWNPSTRKSIKLPNTSNEITNQFGIHNVRVYLVYQIGYDNTNDDYKVVRIMVLISHNRGILDYEIKVYSLTSNSWHRLEKFPHYPDWGYFGNTIVGGAFHFISTVKSDLKSESLIVAFYLGTEECRVLPQPDYSGPHLNLYLSNLEGCLSLSCNYESSIVDVFFLKEYGKKNEHWSKLITLKQTTTFKIYNSVEPIAYSNCGKKVWLNMNGNRLVLYNLEQKSVEEEIRDDVIRYARLLCTSLESLVNLDVPAAYVETEETV